MITERDSCRSSYRLSSFESFQLDVARRIGRRLLPLRRRGLLLSSRSHIASSTIDASADGFVRHHLHIVPPPVDSRPLVEGGPLLLGQCLVSTAQQDHDIPRGGPGVLRKDLPSGGTTPGEEMPRAQRLLRARVPSKRMVGDVVNNECAAAVFFATASQHGKGGHEALDSPK